MGTLRHFLASHRVWAGWLIAAALLMKIVVPTGFMPVFAQGSVAIELCSGFGPEGMTMPGMAERHDGHAPADKGDRADRDGTPCGFAGHAPASMAAADPILLAIAIALIVETIFRMPAARPIHRVRAPRPPSRGPPAIA